jgi:hypothetical protein
MGMTGEKRRPTLGPGAGTALVLAVALAGCNLIHPLDPSLDARFLYADADDDIAVTVDASGAITGTSPASNSGSNTRVATWRRDDPALGDQQACVSWSDAPDTYGHQPGVALRVHDVEGGVVGLTVTRNVYFGAFWGFNVHTWDTRQPVPFTKVGGFGFETALTRGSFVPAPPPWHLCARVVGSVLSLKVWAGDEPEPEWDDPAHGGSVTLPAGWEDPGLPGVYFGHIPSGSSFTLTELTVAAVTAPGAATAPESIAVEPVAPTTPPRAPTAIAVAP